MITEVTSKHVRWMVQVPRLYSIYKKIGLIDSFQDMLDNIFLPLFEVTRDPSSDPKLHWYLKQLVAFDCVDDGSKLNRGCATIQSQQTGLAQKTRRTATGCTTYGPTCAL